MRFIYRLSLCGIVWVTYLGAFNWSNYTNAQLLATKEKAATSGRSDYVQEIQKELSKRGVVATVTLAQAPEGKEWVLQDKNIVLEKKTGGPSLPPPGAGIGQWLFADPQWLYLEKDTGNILDTTGVLMGKIGAIQTTVPDVSGLAQVSSQAEAHARQELEAVKTREKEAQAHVLGVKERVKELESQITDLQQKIGSQQVTLEGGSASLSEQQKSATEAGAPESSGAPEAPLFEVFPGAPEAPPAPDFDIPAAPGAPEAPTFEAAPGAPDAAQQKKAEEKTNKIEHILSKSEYEELVEDVQRKKASDTLFKAIMKKYRMTFPDPETPDYYAAYVESINKAYAALEKNETFCKYNEIPHDECQKDKKKRKNLHLQEEENCYRRSAFDVATCTRRLPEKEAQAKQHEYSLQGINLETFNATKEQYFTLWMEHCNACLFDTKQDLDFEDDVRWVIAYVVASGRKDLEHPSILAQSDSDEALFALFDNPKSTLYDVLKSLRDILTNPQFLKPNGLMISYGATSEPLSPKKALEASLKAQPVMQLLTGPFDGSSPSTQKKLVQSVAFYLTFDFENARQELPEKIISIVQHIKVDTPEVPISAETVSNNLAHVFSESFSSKTIADIIAEFSKYQKKVQNNDLGRAITLLIETPYKTSEIIEALTRAGLPEERLQELANDVFVRYRKPLTFLKLLHEYLDEYNKNTKNYGADAPQTGRKLYATSIRQEIIPGDLKSVFLSLNREPALVLKQVIKFLSPLGGTRSILEAKKITIDTFIAIIEPYGILLDILKNFIQDKDIQKLKAGIEALQSGKLKELDDKYPDAVVLHKDMITNQALYKGRLSDLLKALEKDKFSDFDKAVNTFVSNSGTVNVTPDYQQLMHDLRKTELQAFVTVMKHIITELNRGNYATLQGFELMTTAQLKKNKEYLAAVRSKLTPLLELFKHPETFSFDTYEQAYQELLQSKDFFKKVPQERSLEFQDALRALFGEMAQEYKTLKDAV